MAFGITYEMVITVFVVLLGLLFIVLGYTSLAVPIVQITFLLGIFMTLIGWMNKDYDQFYTGIILITIPLILTSALPSVGIPQSRLESGILYAIAPVLSLISWLYSVHPLYFVLIIIILAYALSKK